MNNLSDLSEEIYAGQTLVIKATGERSERALDSEVNLIAYLSFLGRQQILFSNCGIENDWQRTPVGINGVEFNGCLLSRHGKLLLPRLQGGVLAAVSHPWSGIVELETDRGPKKVDLYSNVPKTVLIDLADGAARIFDAAELFKLKSGFADALSDRSLIDHREIDTDVPDDLSQRRNVRTTKASAYQNLGWIIIRALGERSEDATDELVRLVEIEPIAGLVADLTRLGSDASWFIETAGSSHIPSAPSISSRNGELRLRGSLSGSVVCLCGPDAGLVELDVFGTRRRIDLYHTETKRIRIQFEEDAVPARGASYNTGTESDLQQRRDFYNLAIKHIDPALPLGLYVPRWKGVAASTKNLFAQTLPFPHTAEGHPSDVTPDDIKYFANLLLASGCRHYVVSGGDVFWIDIIRRVQAEEPRSRFDLLWHSNYLQMGEAHDWNLLKNWLRAIADGLVTRMAVVKAGLERLLKRLGVEAVFIPNVIRSNPLEIRYNGAGDLAGIWLSGSSSYRKVPYASLLALKAMPELRLIGAGFDDDSLAMVTELKIPRGEIWRHPLPQEALHRSIKQTSLTFYVTLSECSPMLPIESLHLGVPCLVGANSHLFRTDKYLHEVLVVESPLSPECIAQHARRALAEGERIVEAYIDYALMEQKQAQDAISAFLS